MMMGSGQKSGKPKNQDFADAFSEPERHDDVHDDLSLRDLLIIICWVEEKRNWGWEKSLKVS